MAEEFTTDPHAGEEESALSHALKVVYKRRDDALIVFVAVFGTVLLYTLFVTPSYEARAQLLIEPDTPNVVSFQEVLEQNKATIEYYQTQYRILQSRSLVQRALDTATLWRHPQLVPPEDSGFSLRRIRSAATNWVRRRIGSARAATSGSTAESDAQARTIDAFLAGLTVTPVRNSQIVEIRHISPDAEFAATAVNALAKAYIEQSLEFKYTASQDASDWLRQQLEGQRQAVEESEMALQRYREQNDALSLEERQNIVVQRLEDLNAAATRARTERIAKEADYVRLQEIQNDRASLDTFAGVLTNSFIQQLKGELASLQRRQAELAEQLGDRHPDMLKVRSAIQTAETKLQAEIGKVVQAVRNEYLSAVQQERNLQRALNEQKAEAQLLNHRAIEYGVLERNAATNRQMFDGLLQRAKETGISGELRTSNIRIVDDAEVPRAPSYPKKTTNLLLGLVAGAIASLGFVSLVEYLDRRIKSPAELKAALRLPFLGIIPTSEVGHGELLVNNGVAPAFAESLRSLRTNLLSASTTEGRRSIVVTSTLPGEGKTLVASNLALSLVMAGQRVLLIDADLRRPRVHDLFGLSQEPGLSNLVAGQTKPSLAIRKTSVKNLWVLAAGYVPRDAPELLESAAFKNLLTALGSHFQWLILDSPPVMGVTDAAVLGRVATAVLFVVGSEMTSRGAARAALDQLDAAHVTYVGAVLNRVNLDRDYYYYSDYRRGA